MRIWRFTKADTNSRFIKIEPAQWNMYGMTPREYIDRSHYWFLVTGAYGLTI